MKLFKKPLSSRAWLYRNALLAIFSALSVVHVEAQTTYTVTSATNSGNYATLQATIGSSGSSLSEWQSAGGPNQLAQQWFYYSIDSGPVYSIDQISATPTITSQSGSSASFSALYANANISVTVTFVPSYSAANNSYMLTSTLLVQNPASSGLNQMYHFYQYSDFDLGGVAGGQNVHFGNNGPVVNGLVNQTGPGGVNLVGKISGASMPAPEAQAGVSTPFGLVNGNAAPTLDNITLSAGPGDVDYAYEWDKQLASGTGSFQISEIQTLTNVPEPSSVALMASGMLALAWFHRHRRGGKVLKNLTSTILCQDPK